MRCFRRLRQRRLSHGSSFDIVIISASRPEVKPFLDFSSATGENRTPHMLFESSIILRSVLPKQAITPTWKIVAVEALDPRWRVLVRSPLISTLVGQNMHTASAAVVTLGENDVPA